MKVKVNVKTSPKTQEKYYEQVIAEAHAEMEAMFQENKDLRVSEGHLRDDLACAKALIAELNGQITAREADAAFWKKAAAENAELASEAIAQVAAWERSTHEQGERVREQSEAIARLEAQLAAMNKKNDKLQFDVSYWKGKAEEATAELVKCDESELEHYQDIAARRKGRIDELMEQIRELETELAELNEDYDALVQTKREYSECIDALRQENKRLRNQMPLPEFMRQFIEMTREAVQNEFPDSGNS